jgi:hypothetical protein
MKMWHIIIRQCILMRFSDRLHESLRITFYLHARSITDLHNMRMNHRYLMTWLSLQVVYLWRHVSSTATPFILWWSILEILFGPLHRSSPFIGELRCQAIQMEHGLTYIAERTQNAVYIVRCLWEEYRNHIYGSAGIVFSRRNIMFTRKTYST